MADEILTAQEARDSLSYDALTGVLTWSADPKRAFGSSKGRNIYITRYAGKVAGHISRQTGYLTVRVLGKLYQAHRIAWLINFGRFPSDHVDHMNGDKLDNRIENLRDIGNRENRQNIKAARIDSSSGVHGVHIDKKSGRYVALVRHEGKSWHLGSFDTEHQARCARVQVKAYLHEAWVPSDSDSALLNEAGGPVPPSHFQGRARCDSISGIPGVSKGSRSWRVRVRGKYMGTFNTVDAAIAAHAAYCAAQGDIA